MFNVRKLMVDAYTAAQDSRDPSTQNGAVIVSTDDPLAKNPIWGWNIINPYWPQEYEDRELKYKYVSHAERNAVCKCAKHGVKTSGATMVCPWASCIQCVIDICDAGIGTLIVHKQRMDLSSSWDGQIGEALDLLKRAKVSLMVFDAKLPEAPEILVSGELWQP